MQFVSGTSLFHGFNEYTQYMKIEYSNPMINFPKHA